MEENALQWNNLLTAADSRALKRLVSYQNSAGELFRTPLGDIITHMVNHGTHHRGQMASLMQQEKITAPSERLYCICAGGPD
ncbi:DinB family protein [Cesiribacter andamanensis AMV16]|uniref:DinB family protein n=1 Tax=Cesiribacter andamanensis AMV16 TaxID=1279009 RepID=M7NGG2_9BACT|nr:DinB family protein [Cesiribacter andamanensis AMV16]